MKKIALPLLLSLIVVLFSSSFVSAKPDAEYEKAMRYYNSGNFKEAAKLLEEYVRHKPDATAFYKTGYALYKLKRFEEADEYFRQAYLIEPSFSPQPAESLKEMPPKIPKKGKKPSVKKTQGPAENEEQIQAGIKTKTVELPPVQQPAPTEVKQPQPENKPAPVQKQTAPSEVQKTETAKPAPALPSFPVFPDKHKGFPMPDSMPPAGMIAGILAGFGMLLLVLEIAVYLYFCLCLFLIAKKLDVPNPWIAFIPLAQIWTVVTAAGKPWWWILLLLVPIVNIIIGIMLWMSITENLGRNKWLGLLMLVPIVNFIFVGILAFSKSGEVRESVEEGAPA